MNKTTEALKLAEEALEELHYSSGTVKAVTLYKRAIAIIHEALADQTPYEIGYRLCKEKNGISAIPYEIKCDADFDEAVRGYNDAFYGKPKAVAAPVKQEPVAEVVSENTHGEYESIKKLVDYRLPCKTKLYAALVERQWVDLTDGEIEEAFKSASKIMKPWEPVKAVIVAFKEKNK